MSDYPMLISNKLHSFRNFVTQITKIINRCKVTASIACLTVQKSKRIVQKVGLFCS